MLSELRCLNRSIWVARHIVGRKYVVSQKQANGPTLSTTHYIWYPNAFAGSGASRMGTTLANAGLTDHLGPRDVSAARQWGRGWGWLTAHVPLGLGVLLPNLSSDPEFAAGRWEATLFAGAAQLVEGGTGLVAGTTLAAASPSTGPGAAVLAPAGVAINIGSAVTAAGGAVNVAVALSHIQEMRGSGAGGQPERGVGGSGWRGDAQWRGAVRHVGQGGTIESIGGRVPTASEARALIKESGGRVLRTELPHPSPNPHNYPRINYTTSSGAKGTIRILE